MCLIYRMSNSGNGKGILNAMSGALTGAVGTVTGAVTNVANAAKNAVAGNKNKNSKNATMPVTAGTIVPGQTGGMASINYRSANMQPSEKVMEWATTAGLPTPPASMMRNVAHGGKRRTKRRHSKKRHTTKSRRVYKKRTMKRKTHRRGAHKRRN